MHLCQTFPSAVSNYQVHVVGEPWKEGLPGYEKPTDMESRIKFLQLISVYKACTAHQEQAKDINDYLSTIMQASIPESMIKTTNQVDTCWDKSLKLWLKNGWTERNAYAHFVHVHTGLSI